MSYNYRVECVKLLVPENVSKLVETRDKVLALVKVSGAVTMHVASCCWPGSGDQWTMMAAVDWMVEQGDLVEVQQSKPPAGQHRVFRRPNR